ncbi:MAG TPA: peptide ABC transporter substrate-binding protein [Pyrinomonadaceae bacterium]|nr:peptide ABC transporter substrate-binding protein [Pyrinomonadaceae bacterium]
MINLREQTSSPNQPRRFRIAAALLVLLQIFSAACGELEQPKAEPYYAETIPPRKQEFRWSNGKAPKTFDPALAAAPPETDLVRAVFEGLTELNPETLEAIPAVAEKWSSTEDHKTWTFHLRSNARWSNGRPVTAEDFVRSWKRLGELREKAPHAALLTNIVGFPLERPKTETPAVELFPSPTEQLPPPMRTSPTPLPSNTNSNVSRSGPAPAAFGVWAIDDRTLQVSLIAGDKDFPKLVAHTMFRPVYFETKEAVTSADASSVVTNGSFKIATVENDGISLDRSENYWNAAAVRLERVRFVSTENAEQALAAYRSGDLDAVTNASFEPLVLKLLEPFDDFRRRTHAGINFYEINHGKAPFTDRRVREALAIAIERERLTEGEMEGQTQPALSFLPFSRTTDAALVQDKERARDLLDEAGFPGGKNFPVVRLVINRNDTQQRVARAVARMWKQNLNIETDVVVKDNAEVEEIRHSGEFDLVRRNTVFPTADELMSFLAILEPPKAVVPDTSIGAGAAGVEADDSKPVDAEPSDVIMTEANAVYELWAIPLYFPTSYSLVKPYVSGFEVNSLDAPLLQYVAIDSDWQPK